MFFKSLPNLTLLACLSLLLLNAEIASVVTAGYRLPLPVTVAPGQVITFFVNGIGANIKEPLRAQTDPLPLSLGGISATLRQDADIPVPILAVEPIAPCAGADCANYTAVTVQLPFEMQAIDPTVPVGVLPPGAQILFLEQSIVVAKIDLIALVDQVHLLRTCDVLYSRRDGSCKAVAAHADGSLVTATNPARGGEQIVLYAYGLGLTTPFAATGRSAKEPLPTRRSFTISFDPRQNALASRPQSGDTLKPAAFVGLTPSYTGLYQINVTVPELPPGSLSCYPISQVNGSRIDSNLTINVGGPASFDGVGICVKPPDTF